MPTCPGKDQRFWKPEDIFETKCPACGGAVEFFKDEPKIKCRNCGQMVTNPKIDLGCAQWCQYAQQCVGASAGTQVTVLPDRLIGEMKKVFGRDRRRIRHALAVLNYAEQIQAREGGDPLIVKAAAILHDIGIAESERKYGSSEPKYHQTEGPPIAEKILKNCGLAPDAIDHICKIIAGHHNAAGLDTTEFRIVWDADWLVNIPEQFARTNKSELKDLIDRIFKTETGTQMAIELFIDKVK